MFTKTLILKLRALLLPLILPRSRVTVGRTTVGDILRSKKSGCLMSALVEQRNMASLKKHLSSCNYIFEIIKSCNYIFEIIKLFVSYLCCYFVRTTNICTNITTLQYELYIYISSLPTQLGGGWGSCSETLPYSKFRHISWEQMMTEHRGFSVLLTLTNYKR